MIELRYLSLHPFFPFFLQDWANPLKGQPPEIARGSDRDLVGNKGGKPNVTEFEKHFLIAVVKEFVGCVLYEIVHILVRTDIMFISIFILRHTMNIRSGFCRGS